MQMMNLRRVICNYVWNAKIFMRHFRHGEFTLQPAAGRARRTYRRPWWSKYFEKKGQKRLRYPDTWRPRTVLILHPARFADWYGWASFQIAKEASNIETYSLDDGTNVAALMLTNPTRWIIWTQYRKVAAIVHGRGGLLYGDGAF